MARRENALKSKQVTVSVSPQIYGLLTELSKSGFTARTEAAVAEEMIRKGLNSDGLISEILRQKVAKKSKKLL
jgi:hypothetical protein